MPLNVVDCREGGLQDHEGRAFENEEIANILSAVYRREKVEDVGVRSVKRFVYQRVPNEHNINRIASSMGEKSFKWSDALWVWRIREDVVVLKGSQQYMAAKEARLTSLKALVVETERDPLEGDIAFAAVISTQYGSISAPFSSVAKLMELNGLLSYLWHSKRYHASAVDVDKIRELLPVLPNQSEGTALYSSHWASDIGDAHLANYLKAAKVFRESRCYNLLEEVEGKAWRPERLTFNSLVAVSRGEGLEKGFTRRALERMVGMINEDPKSALELTTEEKMRLKLLRTGRLTVAGKRQKLQHNEEELGAATKKFCKCVGAAEDALKVCAMLVKDAGEEGKVWARDEVSDVCHAFGVVWKLFQKASEVSEDEGEA